MPKRFADRNQKKCDSPVATSNWEDSALKLCQAISLGEGNLLYKKNPCVRLTEQIIIRYVVYRTFFHATSSIKRIKKVRVQVFGKDICSKSTLLIEVALSWKGHG